MQSSRTAWRAGDRGTGRKTTVAGVSPRCCTVAAQKPQSVSGASSYAVIFTCKLQAFSWWACLDSNQGPLPYQRQKRVSWMFAAVQEVLHIGAFSFYGCRVRSPMFRRVVLKLSSIVVG